MSPGGWRSPDAEARTIARAPRRGGEGETLAGTYFHCYNRPAAAKDQLGTRVILLDTPAQSQTVLQPSVMAGNNSRGDGPPQDVSEARIKATASPPQDKENHARRVSGRGPSSAFTQVPGPGAHSALGQPAATRVRLLARANLPNPDGKFVNEQEVDVISIELPQWAVD
jgi:hypothetical protein